MVKVITISDIQKLIKIIGLSSFFKLLIAEIEAQYARWNQFQKSARHAVHVNDGVIELMPISDNQFYSFKYVNGHPKNTAIDKLTVAAVGLLSDIQTGYPLLISEMTLLTAFRTAATSALASKYLAKKNACTFGIIGTGAQAEFQVMAHAAMFNMNTVHYFDIDAKAMEKFHHNLHHHSFTLVPCDSAQKTLENTDIITTATATKSRTHILKNAWVQPGLHINGIGGDCPGKTEMDPAILTRAKMVVEYLPQTKLEGEIQQMNVPIYAELWELVTDAKKGRESNQEITLFDSVGFALEDFAILKLVYELSTKNNIGVKMDLIPEIKNPKDLFGMLK